jgi:cell wall-associated NlpC family hydrolase
LASHRKPHTRVLQSAASRRGAIGVTTAALASVSLLSQSASATPADGGKDTKTSSVAEVKKKVDRLYQRAEASTQKFNAAKVKTDAQRTRVDHMLDQAAERTQKLNDSRRVLGNYATAQYRTGAVSQTATLLLTKNPQQFFDQNHLLDRMTGRQKDAVSHYEEQLKEARQKRKAASSQLASLSSSQRTLQRDKHEVQAKLSEARQLLSKLTAEQKARMAKLERERQEKAREAAQRAEAERKKAEQHGGGSGTGSSSSSSLAGKVLAFARKQLGKPYVWGATGPGSYDCSGLTQDAYKAAGISLPRTTWDQVKAGQNVSKSQLRPGDLVFFYSDISHVGIYVGNGMILHAPHPGANVRYESMSVMPFHSAVRPG